MEPLLFAPEETGGISLEDVFTAYMDCRRRKRGTYNALAFEVDWESRCADLWRRINDGSYRPLRSLVFIVKKPVMREVFAPSFESRVVDHLIARRIEPLLEERFSDDSYSTRKGKGTLFGIDRVQEHIRLCSHDYTRDCYIMKLDIRSFFMDLPKAELYGRMEAFLRGRYRGSDLPTLLYLLRVTYFDNPQRDCVRRGPRSDWNGLPPGKSLFGSDGSRGLPIGRLTSQLGALFYLDPLDHLVQEEWGVPHYGRYVDDMVFVHESREHLKEVAGWVGRWLADNGLAIHPKKFYLQHYSKGVAFIGGMLLPGRRYISNRTLGFCRDALRRFNALAESDPDFVYDHAEEFAACMNSYLGCMKHFASYNLRRKILLDGGMSPLWLKAVHIGGDSDKIAVKKRFRQRERFIREARMIKKGHEECGEPPLQPQFRRAVGAGVSGCPVGNGRRDAKAPMDRG